MISHMAFTVQAIGLRSSGRSLLQIHTFFLKAYSVLQF